MWPGWLGHGRGKARQVRHGDMLDLRFEQAVSQSRMRIAAPDELVVDYTRTMLGALLLCPDPCRIGVVGLGGGSQVKFCRRHLPDASIEAFEIDRRVLAMRRDFHVPDDDAQLTVVLSDAAQWLPQRRGAYSLLLVDGYDRTGIPATLSTQRFVDACRDALDARGVLASNLYCDDYAAHFERLQQAFGANTLLLEEPGQSNRVAFAWRDGVVAAVASAQSVLARLDPAGRAQLAPVFERLARALRERARPVRTRT